MVIKYFFSGYDSPTNHLSWTTFMNMKDISQWWTTRLPIFIRCVNFILCHSCIRYSTNLFNFLLLDVLPRFHPIFWRAKPGPKMGQNWTKDLWYAGKKTIYHIRITNVKIQIGNIFTRSFPEARLNVSDFMLFLK